MKHQFKFGIRLLLTVLLVAMVASSFASCAVTIPDDGNIKEVVSGTPKETSTNVSVVQPTESQTEAETDDSQATIQENVCFNHEGVVVTAKEIVYDSFWGPYIKLLVENNSDKDYSLRVRQLTVNNYMVSDLFSCSVAAGKKSNEKLYIFPSDLTAAGIENIGEIEVYFYLSDPNTYETVYEAEAVTIRTSLYDVMDTVVDDPGFTLLEKDGIKIAAKYVNENTFWGKSIVLYLENNTDQNVTISCTDMSINGFMVTEFFYSTIYYGKRAVDNITILESSLEENDITEIEEFELKFRVVNSDTYTLIFETEALSFRVE